MEQGSAAWHDKRDACAITWSEAANALGVGYDSRQQYMKRKLGIVEKKEANWRMLEGQRREPWAVELYFRLMQRAGYELQLDVDGFRADPQDHRLGGSPDRIVTDLVTGERWLLEIKTCPDGDMRTEIPVSHITQMHGLCHTYNLPFAHYLCWSQGQGILMCEVRWDPTLWTHDLYPRYKQFADWWALRAVPERVEAEEKEKVLRRIKRKTRITEISRVSTAALLQ